jgi:hypothetical protein
LALARQVTAPTGLPSGANSCQHVSGSALLGTEIVTMWLPAETKLYVSVSPATLKVPALISLQTIGCVPSLPRRHVGDGGPFDSPFAVAETASTVSE